MTITIKIKHRKIIKVGSGFAVLVPIAFIRNDLVDMAGLYTIIMEKERVVEK